MKIENDTIKIDLNYFIDHLTDEGRLRLLELYTFKEIIEQIEKQLKGDSDLYSWDTTGWRDGSKLREAIIKIQGLEPEFKKDLESTINSLKHKVDYYKKYYDWYFKIYHYDSNRINEYRYSLIDYIESRVGRPE